MSTAPTQPDAETVRIAKLEADLAQCREHDASMVESAEGLHRLLRQRDEAVRKLVEAARAVANFGATRHVLREALKPFAPAYERTLEAQSATDAGDAPVVKVPRP